MALLSLAQIARELDIPSSTLRYYRDRYANYIPMEGEGRRRRYRPEAIEVFRAVADCMERNMNATETQDRLSRMFPLTIEVDDDKERKTATMNATTQDRNNATTQPNNNARPQPGLMPTVAFWAAQQQTMERMATALEALAEQQEEIQELRKQVEELRNDLEARDRQLVEKLRGKTKSRRWWRRLWPF